MKKSRLNIVEILQGRESTQIYSLINGECYLHDYDERNDLMELCDDNDTRIWYYTDGRADINGRHLVWPSRNDYLVEPLDAELAWARWVSDHAKPDESLPC